MSTIAHQPHHGLHISRPAMREIEGGLLGLLAVLAVSVLLATLPKASTTTYTAPALAAHVAQVHPGMTERQVQDVMGTPTHMAHGRTTVAWTYNTLSGGQQYRLNFYGPKLLSIGHSTN